MTYSSSIVMFVSLTMKAVQIEASWSICCTFFPLLLCQLRTLRSEHQNESRFWFSIDVLVLIVRGKTGGGAKKKKKKRKVFINRWLGGVC